MGIFKKILGGGIAAAGALTGQPGLVAAGGSMVAKDFAKGGKKKPQVAISEGKQTVLPPPTPPPRVAHSLGERRAMNRERMSRVYGVNG